MIRLYREEDAPAVRRCIAELQEFERRIDDRLRPGESMASQYLDYLLVHCRDTHGAILVAEHDGAVAGFVAVFGRVPFESLDDPPGEFALVSDLFVEERYRGRGLGYELLQAAERHAVTTGAREIRVGVLSENAVASSLYRRAGFSSYLETLSKRYDSPAT